MLKILTDNPFRVLGVYANSPLKEIDANKGKITAFLKVGRDLDFPLDLKGVFPPIVRTIDKLNAANAHFSNSEEKIKYSQFWFLKITPLDDIAFNHLIEGDKAKAKDFWSKQETLSSLQNKLVCYLVDNQVKLALITAEKLYSKFGDNYISCVDTNSTLQKSGTQLLHQFIDTLGAEVGMQKLLQYDISESLKSYIGSLVVGPLIENISADVDKAKNVKHSDAKARKNAAQKLMSVSKKQLTQLKDILGEDDSQYQIMADKVGLEILQCGIDYFNNSDDDDAPQTTMDIQSYAKSIVVGDIAKQRCDHNLKILQKIIDELPPQQVKMEVEEIKKALEYYSNGPQNIKSAIKLLLKTRGYFKKIRNNLGNTNGYYINLSSIIVNAALQSVIAEVDSEWNNVFMIEPDLITITLRKALRAFRIMDGFDLKEDFKSYYNSNRSTLESMCKKFNIEFDSGQIYTTLIVVFFLLVSIVCVRSCTKERSMMMNARRSSQISYYINYIDKYPDGKYVKEAEDSILSICKKECTISHYINYVEKFPDGKYVEQAEDSIFAICNREDNFNEYTKVFPNGKHINELVMMAKEAFNLALKTNKLEKWLEFTRKISPKSNVQIKKMNDEIWSNESLAWQMAKKNNTNGSYNKYLKLYPKGKHRKEAIDNQVTLIMASEHGSIPKMDITSPAKNSYSSINIINNTQYNLTILYSGPDSRKVVLRPSQSQKVTLSNGQYRIAATVDAKNVSPFAGTEYLSGSVYSAKYYISTTNF